MKRTFALLILSAMIVSFVAPLIGANNNLKTESITVQEDLIMANIEAENNIKEIYIKEIEKKSKIDIAIENMNIEISEIEGITDKQKWFIAYKTIIDKYSYIIDSPETIYDYFTEEEIYLIQCCVETETYGADFEAKCNVANVIFNRFNYTGKKYPEFENKSIEEIITLANQFAYSKTQISEDTILAIEYAFAIEDTTNGALFFHSNPKTDTWYGADWLFEDSAGHHFYGIKENVDEN